MSQPKKPKRVNYELIKPASQPEMHQMLNDLVERAHDHLTNARIALAWHKALKADVDGRLVLGKAKKASDLDRELMPYDFVIILNREFWMDPETKDVQRTALLDHELSHCEVTRDDDGEPKLDENDRVVYRMRKHDVEEFSGVVARNGIWKRDLEAFAKTLASKRSQPSLFDQPSAPLPFKGPKDPQ